MAANNQNIAHYAPKGRAFCGRMDAHIGVRELVRFQSEPKQCKRCAAKLAQALERMEKIKKSGFAGFEVEGVGRS